MNTIFDKYPLPWKTSTCRLGGENCWCRMVVSATPEDDDENHIIIPSASITKDLAELIVHSINKVF